MQTGGGERGGQRGRREEKKGRGGEEEQLQIEAQEWQPVDSSYQTNKEWLSCFQSSQNVSLAWCNGVNLQLQPSVLAVGRQKLEDLRVRGQLGLRRAVKDSQGYITRRGEKGVLKGVFLSLICIFLLSHKTLSHLSQKGPVLVQVPRPLEFSPQSSQLWSCSSGWF